MKIRKLLAVILALATILSLASCGSGTANSVTTSSNTATTTVLTTVISTETVQEQSKELDFIATAIAGNGIKADGTPVKVGITVAQLVSEFVATAEKYLVWLLEEAGAEVSSAQANDDVNTQMSQVNDFIQSGCDVIIIQPTDSQAMAPAVIQANEAGIPVITINRTIMGDNVKVDLFVGSDDAVMAQMCAEDLIKQANGLNVDVATIQGVLATANAQKRAEGFAEYVSNHANINVVADRPCDWKNEMALPATTDMLIAHPQLYGIFSHSDCMLQGIFSGLAQSDRLVPRGEDGHLVLYAIDGDAYALEKIREGYLDGTVEQSPVMMATVTAKAVLTRVAKGKPLNGEAVLLTPTFINYENVDNMSHWGNFNIGSGELWPLTSDVWENYLK